MYDNLDDPYHKNIKGFKTKWPDWELVSFLGAGSQGRVYKVSNGESEAAIKYLPIEFPNSVIADDFDKAIYLEKKIRNYQQELELLLPLKDLPNIIHVEDYYIKRHPDSVDMYIFMELATSLDAYLGEAGFTEKDLQKLGIDICTALDALHSKKLIHRDIKPSNIFYNNGCFKLGDFAAGVIISECDNTINVSEIVGNRETSAPEVLLSQKYDNSCDIYSLGMTMYLLANKKKRIPVRNRIAGIDLPPIRSLNSELFNAIKIACSFKPINRFKNANAFKHFLENIHIDEDGIIYEKGEVNIINNNRFSYDDDNESSCSATLDSSPDFILFWDRSDESFSTSEIDRNDNSLVNDYKDSLKKDDSDFEKKHSAQLRDPELLKELEALFGAESDDDSSVNHYKDSLEKDDSDFEKNHSAQLSDQELKKELEALFGAKSDDDSSVNTNKDTHEKEDYEFKKNHLAHLSSWLFSTCMISLIPTLFYLLSIVFVINIRIELETFLHEFIFFAIVLFTTMIKTVFFGKGKYKYKKRLYTIGAIAILLDIVAFILFSLIISSEVIKHIELRKELLPLSLILCFTSIILGGITEYMEDLAS